ncbi:hypothetical protein M2272_005702 [Mycobacterium frederiksbergense]|uniref:Uncharacterized protein n=1 Tax=Mycolicibacterium frederiksbergense TaxID=117567 RepID=A0ABT6L7Z9_9MYCO|nr:hypothetical protein [Mycolicibacterium frederiksbergense]MDH6199035.1 hypothetical protein [Mycolicibacterium frederiksbergense]
MLEGYVYVADEKPGPMTGAVVGVRVAKTPLEPPWIVVNHALAGGNIDHWPGRLFRVACVPPRSPAEDNALARAAENLRADAGYSRVVVVDVIEELDAAILFGPHGTDIIKIIEVGRLLTEDRAKQLAAQCNPGAEAAYNRAWAQWLAVQPNGSFYLNDEHLDTLLVPGAGPSGSPIGNGFLVVSEAVRRRAQQGGGSGAFTINIEGEETMADPWATARASLQHAAMAYGAPDLISAADHAVLTQAWLSTVGHPR